METEAQKSLVAADNGRVKFKPKCPLEEEVVDSARSQRLGKSSTGAMPSAGFED